MRTLLVILLAVGSMAQAQDPPPEHLTERGREIVNGDPQAFCYIHKVNEHAHECTCQMMCSTYTNPDTGQAESSRQEDSSCTFYCSKRRCICHADENCPDPSMERPR